MKKSHLIVCLSAFCLLSLAGIAEDLPKPEQLIQTADSLTDLSQVQPYKLTATVALRPGKNEIRGQLVIYQDHDRSSSELRIGKERQTQVRLHDKLYIARTSTTAFFGIGRLNVLENIWKQEPSGPEKVKLGRVSRKKINGGKAFCFKVQKEGYDAQKRCIDVATRLPVRSGASDTRYEFFDFQTIGQQRYPGKIRMEKNGRRVLEVRDIHVEKQALSPDVFSVPPGSEELDTCDDMRSAKSLSIPDLNEAVTGRVHRSVTIYVSGIVKKDGSYRPVEVVAVPPDPELVQFVKANAAELRYSPAMCGSKPVTTENQIEIHVDRQNY